MNYQMPSKQLLQMGNNANERIVVKVQQSLSSTLDYQTVLIYDEARKFEYQGPLPKELKDAMGDRLKVYFNADLIPDKDDKGVPKGTFKFNLLNELEEEVPEW